MISGIAELVEKERVIKFGREARVLFSLWDIMAKFNVANCCELFAAIGQRCKSLLLVRPEVKSLKSG